MGLVIELVPNKQNNGSGDRDVGRYESSPVEWMLERHKTLDEEDEYIQEEIEAIYPDRAKHLEGVCRGMDPLLQQATANAEVREYDSGPGDVRSGATNRGEIGKHLAWGDAQVHQREESPHA